MLLSDKGDTHSRGCRIQTAMRLQYSFWRGWAFSSIFPLQSSPPFFQISDKIVWPSVQYPRQEMGKTHFLVLIMLSACQAIGPPFLFYKLGMTTYLTQLSPSAPFPPGDYIRTLVYENKLHLGPWAFLRTALYKYKIPFVFVCSPGDLRKEVESQWYSFLWAENSCWKNNPMCRAQCSNRAGRIIFPRQPGTQNTWCTRFLPLHIFWKKETFTLTCQAMIFMNFCPQTVTVILACCCGFKW